MIKTILWIFVVIMVSNLELLGAPVSGVVTNSQTGTPIANVVVKILQTNDSTQTNSAGYYLLSDVADGMYTMLFGAQTYQPLIRLNAQIGVCCIGNTGNTDNDPADQVDISDLTMLISHLFVNLAPLVCPEEGNIDGDAGNSVDISDLTALIDHLFINLQPTSACR
ncbi:MAG: carboxypeptidase regulatory-like domain-containing protein [candidate division Zixibacteria bacterium]|nr:carboxypeptidase regulatory-like domain-containing protein [candidate division Zixibacteria bacterium]